MGPLDLLASENTRVNHDMAVAVLDMLGYSDLIEHRSPDHVARVLGALVRSSWSLDLQRDLDRYYRTGQRVAPQLGSAIASDTLFMYLPRDEAEDSLLHNPGDLLLSFCYAVAQTVARCLYRGIKLRGGVAYGPAFVSIDPTFVVGRPFVEAHRLEVLQEWVGAAFAKSAEDALLGARQGVRESFVVACDVPLKSAKSPGELRPKYAVNWAAQIGSVVGTPPPNWDDLFPASDVRLAGKRANTLRFFDMFRGIGSPSYIAPDEDRHIWDSESR
jgi:hypothetical protein